MEGGINTMGKDGEDVLIFQKRCARRNTEARWPISSISSWHPLSPMDTKAPSPGASGELAELPQPSLETLINSLLLP